MTREKIRYAVVGLGYISQAAVLPAFKHAARNSELTALVSEDSEKLKRLSRRYGVRHTFSYEQYEECLASGLIDAVYIALPNTMHRDYAVRAAKARIHVLCEKPMATTTQACQDMLDAADAAEVQLMIAYRLHLEAGNLAAIEAVKSGKIGDPRFFLSSFSQQVKEGDIRLQRALGGGSVWDMGIYCVNAARYLFQAEPIDVFAFSANNGDKRFSQVDEMASVTMRFPEERLAMFTSSFGAADTSAYRVVGTKGEVVLEPAFDYSVPLKYTLSVNGKKRHRLFPKKDQFAAELVYFSDCVLRQRPPEPSGKEGLADVRVIEAIYQSAASGLPVTLDDFHPGRRPSPRQKINLPPVKGMPPLVHASSPSGDR